MSLNLENAEIAIQKNGRLTELSLGWLNQTNGCDFPVNEDPFDKTREMTDKSTGITVVGCSNGDTVKTVVCGLADLAIAGDDTIEELRTLEGGRLDAANQVNQLANLERLQILSGAQWRLSLARPIERGSSVRIDRLATSFPKITRGWLRGKPFFGNPQIDTFAGGVEAFGRRKKYDAIVEIVESGDSLAKNGFEEVEVIRNCAPWLIRAIRNPLSCELYDSIKSTSILDLLSRRLLERKNEPTASEASRLVRDPNEARKKVASEAGELIAELATNGNIVLESADLLYALSAALVASRVNVRAVEVELAGRYNGQALLPLTPKTGRLQFVEDSLSRIVNERTIL